ncbi:MAG: hypothetical protein G5701_01075 [Serratia symbiotica]|nr:hypothetical protein [Serratia symbiotica]
MGIQNSPSDCAIFYVSTARNLYKNTETLEVIFSKLNNRGKSREKVYSIL